MLEILSNLKARELCRIGNPRKRTIQASDESAPWLSVQSDWRCRRTGAATRVGLAA
jgi:hypothetical protein